MARPNTIPKTDPPVLLTDATEKDLRVWMEIKLKGLTGQYAGANLAWCKEARTVLIGRGIDPNDIQVVPDVLPAQPAQTAAPKPAGNGSSSGPARSSGSTAIASAQPTSQMIVGTFANAEHASRALVEAASQYHLVSPATVVGRLPEGCEVVVSLVQIDPYSNDVYAITGNKKEPKDTDTVGLDRVSLAKIAAAAGVTWVSSRRTDDGSHPHYCAWEAVARFPHFDMTTSDIPGNVDIDTREDGDVRGAAAEEIRTKAEARRIQYPQDKNDGGDSQLLELRKFLLRHCESKAMNKAIGNKGVRRSYKRSELKKPFAVARLIFTGASDDPEARRDFRQMIGQRFLQASHQAFGGGPTQQVAPPRLAPPVPQWLQPHAPPPIGTSLDQGSYDEDGDRVVDVPQPQPTPKPDAQQPPAVTATQKPVAAATKQEEFPT